MNKISHNPFLDHTERYLKFCEGIDKDITKRKGMKKNVLVLGATGSIGWLFYNE
jgi:hypothetical protein